VIHWFDDQIWFGVGSNMLQYLGTFGVFSLIWGAWHHRCRGTLLCVRPGQVAVAGTTYKVCPRHSTPHHHEKLRLRHAERHSERIGHGVST